MICEGHSWIGRVRGIGLYRIGNILKSYVTHDSCRLCGQSPLNSVLDLGNQYISDFVTKDHVRSGRTAPLELVKCENCTLIQLKDTAPQELLYTGNYWYKSGVTETMKQALRELYDVGIKESNLQIGDFVLDIGANDGTLLKNFSGDYKTVGCEPAKNLQIDLVASCDYVLNEMWSFQGLEKVINDTVKNKFKLIYAIGMFYDLDNPIEFVSDIEKCLHPDGVFISQLMCLKSMLDANDLGNICHEHIEYYSFESLKYLFEKCGLEIYKIEINNINGGSYRIFAQKYKNGSISFEENISDNSLEIFKNEIINNKTLCVDFIKNEVILGKKIHLYGASTKGNTILQYYGLSSSDIPFASERSINKVGLYTIGTGIPIVSEDFSRQLNPDFYLVMPWAFIDEFVKRELEWLKAGGKFILPLPNFRLISYEDIK
jgi:NDP-4-keto-2,6-dideoxyhexose 3-C-methyltransferase